LVSVGVTTALGTDLEDNVRNAGGFIHQKQHVFSVEALQGLWIIL